MEDFRQETANDTPAQVKENKHAAQPMGIPSDYLNDVCAIKYWFAQKDEYRDPAFLRLAAEHMRTFTDYCGDKLLSATEASQKGKRSPISLHRQKQFEDVVVNPSLAQEIDALAVQMRKFANCTDAELRSAAIQNEIEQLYAKMSDLVAQSNKTPDNTPSQSAGELVR